MVTNEERLGNDVLLDTVDTDDIQIGARSDFKIIEGSDNLRQGIINRLRTGVAELSLHPAYGCRLPTLIGTVPNDFTIPLARQFIREALLQEPRLQSIDRLSVQFVDDLRTTLRVEIDVISIVSEEPLNIVFPFFITGES